MIECSEARVALSDNLKQNESNQFNEEMEPHADLQM